MKGLPFFVVLRDSLDLNEQEKKDILLFLKNLDRYLGYKKCSEAPSRIE